MGTHIALEATMIFTSSIAVLLDLYLIISGQPPYFFKAILDFFGDSQASQSDQGNHGSKSSHTVKSPKLIVPQCPSHLTEEEHKAINKLITDYTIKFEGGDVSERHYFRRIDYYKKNDKRVAGVYIRLLKDAKDRAMTPRDVDTLRKRTEKAINNNIAKNSGTPTGKMRQITETIGPPIILLFVIAACIFFVTFIIPKTSEVIYDPYIFYGPRSHWHQ